MRKKILLQIILIVVYNFFSCVISQADDDVDEKKYKQNLKQVLQKYNNDKPKIYNEKKVKIYAGIGWMLQYYDDKKLMPVFGGLEYRIQRDATNDFLSPGYPQHRVGFFIAFEGEYNNIIGEDYTFDRSFEKTKNGFLIRDRIKEEQFIKNIPLSAKKIAGGSILIGAHVSRLTSNNGIHIETLAYGILGIYCARVQYMNYAREQVTFNEYNRIVDTNSTFGYYQKNQLLFEPGIGIRINIGRFFMDLRFLFALLFDKKEFTIDKYADAYYPDGTKKEVNLSNVAPDLYTKFETSSHIIANGIHGVSIKGSIGLYLF